MKIIEFIRLLRKHIVLLLLTPLILAVMVTFMTRKPDYKFASQTTLYTGIASGSSVEMDKSINFFATNTAFDNLINVIKSRQTQQEVAIRLLSIHLMLDKSDPAYISSRSFAELKHITPPDVFQRVIKNVKIISPKAATPESIDMPIEDSLAESSFFSFDELNDSTRSSLLPASIDPDAYELTVKNLTDLMESSDSNFVYKLLNFVHPHYSIKAISSINVQRIANSDLVQLKFESDDPGICQLTLLLMTEVCIKNFKVIKENRSDAIVKYFEFQLKQVAGRLKVAEDKLLKFNTDNNIINYYEQSKAVAVVKEQLDVEYNNKRIKLAGIEAAIKSLEGKLGVQQQIQLKSNKLIEKRDQLGELNYKITSSETVGLTDNKDIKNLSEQKVMAEKLKEEIKKTVGDLYSYTNSIDGLPISTILNDWIANVIDFENTNAGIMVMGERIKEFQKQYAIYAPAGANVKRIEREVSVSEQEFLEILHGLNLAKLKMQDNELSSNIKAIDLPYFPLSPIPTKRKMLVLLAAFAGFILLLGGILAMEYFDDTLKNPAKASKILALPLLGVFPKIFLKVQNTNFLFITNRLLEIAIQNIELQLNVNKSQSTTKTLLIFSTLSGEGKSVFVGNLAQKLKKQGSKVAVLNFSHTSLQKTITTQIGYPETTEKDKPSPKTRRKNRLSIIGLLLGYPDSRIDYDSPFLENPETYLGKDEYFVYNISESFYSSKNYLDILEQNGYELTFVPDFVLVELPPVLYYPYPVALFSDADLPIMVCRSNRVWSEADQAALDTLEKLTIQKTHYMLNGVELPVIESLLGDLPRKRSRLRRILKKAVHFQFFSRNKF